VDIFPQEKIKVDIFRDKKYAQKYPCDESAAFIARAIRHFLC
jgi:hypothetical protein